MKTKGNNLQRVVDGDINLRSYGLKVDETGESIVLTGVVDTLSEKEHAEKILKDAAGGKRIEMAVSISTDGAIDDRDVAMEVAEEIAGNPELEGRVNARVEKGVAHLSGNVDSLELKQDAGNKAASARGVTKVTSEIKVNRGRTGEDPEEIFHSQVRNDREDEDE